MRLRPRSAFSGPTETSPSLVLPEATLTNTNGNRVLGGGFDLSSIPDRFCFAGASGCDDDGEIVFSGAVTNLMFEVDGGQTGDNVIITAFNGLSALSAFNITSNESLDLSFLGEITRLTFDDQNSTSLGFAYRGFQFDQVAPVPVPASLPLLLGSAGLLAALRRRKARSA